METVIWKSRPRGWFTLPYVKALEIRHELTESVAADATCQNPLAFELDAFLYFDETQALYPLHPQPETQARPWGCIFNQSC